MVLTLPPFQTLPTYNLIHYLPYYYTLYLIQFIERKLIYSIKMKIISIKKMEGFILSSVPNIFKSSNFNIEFSDA